MTSAAAEGSSKINKIKKISADPRVARVWEEDNGIWVKLAPRWETDEGLDYIHEENVGEALRRLEDVERVGGEGAQEKIHCPDGTCQPFTTLVRDEAKFAQCMKLAATVGELSNSKNVVKLIRGHMGRQDQEIFVCVCLDMRGQLRDFVEVARGQRHRVATDIEDIIRPIILSGCDGAVVCHCHPSGVTEPSEADDELTRAIREGMKVACPTIKFLDHLVVSPFSSYSFADNGWKGDGKVEKA